MPTGYSNAELRDIITNNIRYWTGGMFLSAEPVPIFFSHFDKIQTLRIIYKDDSEYTVKNAYNIQVVRRKSGGFDIKYDYDFVVERNLPHGKERVESDKHVETTTGDVKAIQLVGRKENGVRRTEIVEFGGK